MATLDGRDDRTGDYRVLQAPPHDLTQTFTLADDATVTLGTLVAGKSDGVYLVHTASEVGLYVIDGTTVLIGPAVASADFDDADTDGDICLYNSSGSLILKNRLGSTKTIKVTRLA